MRGKLIGLSLSVLVLAGGMWIADREIPPQHLPWKPLRLSDPVGLATDFKLTRAARDPAACRKVLQGGDVAWRDLPESRQGDFCAIRNGVALESGATALRPANPSMTCGEALAYALWMRQSVQPAARELLGAEVAAVEHYGTYACRRMYGRSEGSVSQHASANALDVAGFRLKDGRRVSVRGDWPGTDAEAAFLRRVRDGACGVFSVVLSPDYNAAHADHLHLDMGSWRSCS